MTECTSTGSTSYARAAFSTSCDRGASGAFSTAAFGGGVTLTTTLRTRRPVRLSARTTVLALGGGGTAGPAYAACEVTNPQITAKQRYHILFRRSTFRSARCFRERDASILSWLWTPGTPYPGTGLRAAPADAWEPPRRCSRFVAGPWSSMSPARSRRLPERSP